MTHEKSLMVIAGEVSGDMHAARLVDAIRERDRDVTFFGIGGGEMRRAGVETVYDVTDMAVAGVTEVWRKFGFLKRVFYEMLDLARERRPSAVILVDYPGFNIRFATQAHRLGLRTIYYICPQVWAWNRSRIARIARAVDRLITIFPFEARYFENTGLRVEFAGHPLVDEARLALDRSTTGLPWDGTPQLALLPGSRDHEIELILPVMWRAAALLEEKHPQVGFIVATPSAEVEALVRKRLATLSGGPSRASIVMGNTREVLRQARAALVASGTATLEASLMRCPMVVVYRVRGLTYLLGRLLIRVSDLGMVNIVAGRRVCPELIQGRATPEALCTHLDALLADGPVRTQMIADMEEVNRALGSGGAEQRAADIVLDEMTAHGAA